MSKYYISGISRAQEMLLPNKIDDYVKEDSFAKLIEAYIETLNLGEMGFYRVKRESRGRSGFDPKDMLKLYIYGYVNNIRSSRKLEVETKRNIELIWLMRNLKPDFKTISDFRKNNIEGIMAVEKSFVAFLMDIDLIDGKSVGIDGTKIKAVNSRDKVHSENRLEKGIKEVEEKINKYLEEMNENDKEEEKLVIKKEEIMKKISKLKEKKRNKEELKAKLKEIEEIQIAETDSECRLMKTRNGYEAAYNCQIVVDSKNKLIISHSVTNELNDINQLLKMGRKAKELFKGQEIEVLADKGYYNALEIKELKEEQVNPLIPDLENRQEHNVSGIPSKGYYRKDFKYNEKEDTYKCPAGNILIRKYLAKDGVGKEMGHYMTDACKNCELRGNCTRNKHGRVVYRWVEQKILDEIKEELQQKPDKMKLRSCLVEHPFGTIKRAFGHGYFIMKGLRKVSGEFALTILSYNLKRAVKIKGFEALKNIMI